MDDNNITSTNFDYDIYTGGNAESAVNEIYAEEQKEIERAEKLAKRANKNKLDFTGVESVTGENIDSLIFNEEPEPEPVEMDDPTVPTRNDLRDRAQTYRNYEPPEGYRNPYQSEPQKPIPAYQVGANDPYATDNFQSTYTDTSNYQAEAMAARMRGQTVTYGQQMYGATQQGYGQLNMQMPQQGQPYAQPQTSPYDAQGRYDPQNVYGQNGQYRQQGSMPREQGMAMVDQMMSQDRMMSRGSLYSGSRSRYSSTSSSAIRPGMSKRERGLAQVDQMMAQDRASHQTTDTVIGVLNQRQTGHFGRDIASGYSAGLGGSRLDERSGGGGGDMAWYFLWFAVGALIPFGAFNLPFEFCIIIGAVFGLIGAVILHNGKEGFDFKTSLSMSKTELLLIPVCAVIGVLLYFFY
ncbi:MAG: hypothetical protein IJ571_06985 [Ruminococcus sp.]|nr:hypothetical protein [Ruminococcus sp.]